MLPEALIRRGLATASLNGYTPRKTSWVLRITPKGDFVSLRKEARNNALPIVNRAFGVLPCSGIDNYQYLLGVGAPGRDVDWAAKYHEAYKKMLVAAPGPGAKAILAFLDNPNRPLILPVGTDLTDAEAAEVLQFKAKPSKVRKERDTKLKQSKVLQTDPMVQGVYGCLQANARAHHRSPDGAPILFVDDPTSATFDVEVEEHPLWYQTPEFQKFHFGRLTTKNGDKRGTCSLCHQDKVLARTFPGSVKLVTFNESAWGHFGAKQAYNAPTCMDCAYYFTQGLSSLLKTKGAQTRIGDKNIIWWSDNPEDPPMFDLLDTVLDKDTTPEAREEAITAFTDGHLAVFEVPRMPRVGRATLQRYYQTSADVVRANIRRWLDTIGTQNVYATSYLLLSKVAGRSQGSNTNAIQMLFLDIIANEKMPPQAIRTVHDLMQKESNSFNRRGDLIHYIKGSPMDITEPTHPESYSPQEKAAFWYGMAFGKAETNQRGKSNPQRTIADRFYRSAKKSPSKCMDICEKFSCQKVISWFQQADNFLKQAGGPRIFNPSAQRAFSHGYNSYKVYRMATRAAHNTKETTP